MKIGRRGLFGGLFGAVGAAGLAKANAPELELEAEEPEEVLALLEQLERRYQPVGVVRAPERRDTPLGFHFPHVAPGASIRVTAVPLAPFRGEVVILDHETAGAFLLESIEVGRREQLRSARTHGIPTRLLRWAHSDSFVLPLSMDPAPAHSEISITAKNVSTEPAMFNGAILGQALR